MVSASAMLERFLFNADAQYSLIGKLSGGEKRRLNLLRVLMEAPNILILDEPTNDLDIATLTILEDYLDSFAGIVVIVSHDRYFLDRTVKRIFAFDDEHNITQYEGGYTDYINKVREDSKTAEVTLGLKDEEKDQKISGKNYEKPREKKLKFSYQEAKEYETIEDDVAKLEERIELLIKDMTKYARDFVKLNEITKEKEELQTILDEKMERWMYLEELKAKIDAR